MRSAQRTGHFNQSARPEQHGLHACTQDAYSDLNTATPSAAISPTITFGAFASLSYSGAGILGNWTVLANTRTFGGRTLAAPGAGYSQNMHAYSFHTYGEVEQHAVRMAVHVRFSP